MARRTRAFWCVAAAFWAVFGFSSKTWATPYLSAEIDAALVIRADFLRLVDIAESDFLSLPSWVERQDKKTLINRLSRFRESGNPWYHYISGVTNEENKDSYFERAVSASQTSGTLWLLALEFIRYDNLDWAMSALTAIETNTLARGGSSSPFLSMQLMLLGNEAATTTPKQAEFCYNWAKRFDKSQCWWLYRRGAIDFPNNVINTAPIFLVEAGNVLANSWRAQIAFVCGTYRFLSATLFIFICAIIFVFAVKYLPSGVHRIGDALFSYASPRFRTFSSLIIVVALPLLGILPTLWVTIFLIFRFLSAAEKKLLILICALLALSPLNPYVTIFLERNTYNTSPATLLDRAITEGYSNGLLELIMANVNKNPNNYVNQLALAVSAAKNRSFKISADALNKALQSAPDDPLALLCAGNISFWMGSEEGMEKYYGKLIKQQPKYAEAKYNLAQAYVDKGGFTSADMITDAAKINPNLISAFMRENEHYFEGEIPYMRHIIQTPVSSQYFWGSLFIASPMEILEPGKATFRNMNPLMFFGMFALLFIMLLIVSATVWNDSGSKVRKYFICRVCGRLICKKCRKGTLCAICYRANLDAGNNAVTMYNLQKKYQTGAQLRKDIIRCVIGIIIPGAAKLYNGDAVVKPALAMFVASAVFAAYYCAFTFHTSYPKSVAINPLYYVSILSLYNITALIKQIAWLIKTLKMRSKLSTGIR